MSGKGLKAAAKYNALRLAATVIENHCSSAAFVEELGDNLPQDLLDEIDKELTKIVKSLSVRADNENAKYTTDLPDLVEFVQTNESVKY